MVQRFQAALLQLRLLRIRRQHKRRLRHLRPRHHRTRRIDDTDRGFKAIERMNPDPHDLSALEKALGHRFACRGLLEQALTHASYARERESQNAAEGFPAAAADNEQMEFLGDAVLGFVVSRELFQGFPEYQEGELSKLRAHLVSASHLLRPARELVLGQYLRLGLCWGMRWRRALPPCSSMPAWTWRIVSFSNPSLNPASPKCTRTAAANSR